MTVAEAINEALKVLEIHERTPQQQMAAIAALDALLQEWSRQE